MTTISDRLDRNSEAWKPSPGDKLIGVVTELSENTTEYGTYPILNIENSDGEFAFHAYHTVAMRELERLRPTVGDEIGVVYKGKETGKSGNSYQNYRIVVDRNSPRDGDDVDWSGVKATVDAAPDAAPEPAAPVDREPSTGQPKAAADDLPF